ncbi:hypothetical protein RSOLAG1IB_06762 [Rhizoctonia solani AG-1 IB]|uniref:Uncharacterized protein n=1 Tax=Thanatephorus cucumeris (strain AG1-IB / isolate 7/3/14) TaxID=1108050 RepID=A0A0B7FD01_THACB|nr:hypothetical protein RSOLAG1IB_06762 [Rhizoctonia solani AG-1 IB]
MSSLFTTDDYICAPAIITYDDDDKLINVVMNFGSKGTCTFKTDNTLSGNLHPFSGQIFYNSLDNALPGASIRYSLRTGGRYAIVIMGAPDHPTSGMVVAYSDRIVSKTFNEGEGDWSIAQPKSLNPPRVFRRPASFDSGY